MAEGENMKYRYEIEAVWDYNSTSVTRSTYCFSDEKSAYAAMGKAASELTSAGHIIIAMRILIGRE